ncbi:MAG: sulfatase-like hydrolase/transferase [Micromonosporaceae bacterium]|nr:sulfatase-like hydrolase/transferase [Micromonosporaceae bacterium]
MRPPVRRALSNATSVLAFLLVFVAMVAPNALSAIRPKYFVSIPIEALVCAALFVVLPRWPRRVLASIVGVLLGLLAILKMFDMGFREVFARPFDPILDWALLGDGVEFVWREYGRVAGIGVQVLAGLVAAAALTLMALAVLRLSRLAARHRREVSAGVGVLAVAWVVCFALGAQIVPGLPVASTTTSRSAYQRVLDVRHGLQDAQVFAAESKVDAFRGTPANQLLTGLRGKDFMLTFIESYGRVAIQDPQFAPQMSALLGNGYSRLRSLGFSARSGYLTSSTSGGGSWLAHSTMESGLWINNQRRYRTLVQSDRFTLTSAFRTAGWRTTAILPATAGAWPEGSFYGFKKVYEGVDLGYKGPPFVFGTAPDQYTLSAFQRLEHGPAHAPLMAEVVLVSSHAPWSHIPAIADWNAIGDGADMHPHATPAASGTGRDAVRAGYIQTIEYSLNSLISYLATYGDDNLVMVFLGDHQPAPIVTGDNATRDVPVTLVAKDPKVLDRIASWGWQEGLDPGSNAPVWRMDTFRNRFLTAFGSQPAAPTASHPGN